MDGQTLLWRCLDASKNFRAHEKIQQLNNQKNKTRIGRSSNSHYFFLHRYLLSNTINTSCFVETRIWLTFVDVDVTMYSLITIQTITLNGRMVRCKLTVIKLRLFSYHESNL